MRIVSNTGPLIALSAVGEMSLLQRIYGEVWVSTDVRDEIAAGPKLKSEEDLTTVSWLRIEAASTEDDLLSRMLDKGEASAIRLARQIGADMILIDERKGRKIAADIYGLRVIGTAGVLVHAKNLGLISSVTQTIRRMKEVGYWIDEAVLRTAAEKAGESV